MLEGLGALIQAGLRQILRLLIGRRAYDWKLDTLPETHRNYRYQRGIREIIAAFVVTFIALTVVPKRIGVGIAMLVIFSYPIGAAVRAVLEEQAKKDEGGDA